MESALTGLVRAEFLLAGVALYAAPAATGMK